MRHYGLRKEQIKSIIEDNLNRNPDIFYYIEDHYIQELVSLLSDGIAESIERNNEKITRDLTEKRYF